MTSTPPPSIDVTSIEAQQQQLNEARDEGETDQTTAPTESTNNTDQDHAPALGSRIQVLWRIIHNDPTSTEQSSPSPSPSLSTDVKDKLPENASENAADNSNDSHVEERWWGAAVQDCTSETVGARCPAHANVNVHILLYDAYNDFPEEIVRVAFLPDNILLDLAMLEDTSGGRLDWQYESDAFMSDGNMNNESNVCSAEFLAREADAIVQQSGISADADLQALSAMPHDVQLHVASGYRSFADSIKQNLGELINSKPTDYVVTVDDVQNIMARVRSQQRQRAEGLAGAAL